VLVSIYNITEVKNLQLQLQQYVEDLKRSNANLEEFAYAASHDLKEPIRKIKFFTDYIKNDASTVLTVESKLIFERLTAASSRMGVLIDDLLAYSQISFQSRVLDDVDLNEVIRLALSDLDILVEEKKALIKFDKLPKIKGDARQLQQLFLNLLSNSLKYTRPGTNPEITIAAESIVPSKLKARGLRIDDKLDYYHITVRDNGIGFKQEDAERIFNVFQRLHGHSEIKGTGIGLAIVRRVMENHKGYIWADAKLGEGAVFNLLFPA
jgi:light-regulated signal transduction histidine kinase (bacteriophytochrome)